MIKNNLAVLLAERGLKIGDAHIATGISRNTLSSFVNSKANGIQYDTLNKLCEYLDVSPGDLLTHIRFEIKVIESEEINDELTTYDVRIKLQDETIDTKIEIRLTFKEEGIDGIAVDIPPSVFNKLSIIPKDYIIEELRDSVFTSIAFYNFDNKVKVHLSKQTTD